MLCVQRRSETKVQGKGTPTQMEHFAVDQRIQVATLVSGVHHYVELDKPGKRSKLELYLCSFYFK